MPRMRGWCILGRGGVAGWENGVGGGPVGMKLRTRRSVLRSGSRGRRMISCEGLELIAVGGGSAVDVIVLW